MVIPKLVSLLSNLPEAIAETEQAVISATRQLHEAKERLSTKESELILEGKITGKNDTERKAQLLALTLAERQAVADAEDALSKARLEYNKKVNEFKAARSIAALFSQLSTETTAVQQPSAAPN